VIPFSSSFVIDAASSTYRWAAFAAHVVRDLSLLILLRARKRNNNSSKLFVAGLYKIIALAGNMDSFVGRHYKWFHSQVVLRKILGTLCNDKGSSIHERIMTTLATWGQKGPDSLQMLTAMLAS
jgi:hypothetical protein